MNNACVAVARTLWTLETRESKRGLDRSGQTDMLNECLKSNLPENEGDGLEPVSLGGFIATAS
jgi:hypothetical protein